MKWIIIFILLVSSNYLFSKEEAKCGSLITAGKSVMLYNSCSQCMIFKVNELNSVKEYKVEANRSFHKTFSPKSFIVGERACN
jgi:hypothetical protein